MALRAELRKHSTGETIGTATIVNGTVVGDGAFGNLSKLTVFDQYDKQYEADDGESYLRQLPNAFANMLLYVEVIDDD